MRASERVSEREMSDEGEDGWERGDGGLWVTVVDAEGAHRCVEVDVVDGTHTHTHGTASSASSSPFFPPPSHRCSC